MDQRAEEILGDQRTMDDLIQDLILETVGETDTKSEVLDLLWNLSHNYIASLITQANQVAELQGTRTINQE